MADLIRDAMPVCDSIAGEDGCAEMGDRLRVFLLGSAKKDMVRFVATASGARVPGIFKKSRENGCVVERTPLCS